jgi:MFS family permease
LPKLHRVHYGWIIAATGSLVLFSCLGLARYAYTMLLPRMQAGLGLPYERMGFIGTANFSGYLLSVLLAPLLIRRYRPRLTITCGLVLIAICMLAISLCSSYSMLTILYTLVGMGGGFANIPLMALVTYWFRSEQRGRAAGLVIGGNGAAIIFAGFLVPKLNLCFGAEGWRSSWLVFGLVTLASALAAGTLLCNAPADKGLEPVGRPVTFSSEEYLPHERHGDGRILLKLGLLYLAFGATFMVYGTFIVTTMVREYGFSEGKAGFYWSWVGFFSLFSGVLFGGLSDRIGRKWGLMLVFLLQTVAYGLAGLRPGPAGLAVSIVLYGLAVFAIPAIMAAAMGDYLGLSRAATAFATVTLFFAAGQTIGPWSAGIIAGQTGSFTTAYLLSALITALAALYAAMLPKPAASSVQVRSRE